MAWRNLLIGLSVGLIVGFALRGTGFADPPHIKNLRSSTDESGPSYVLAKQGLGGIAHTDQIAIIHGLIDDGSGCQVMVDAMSADGGDWYCIPVDQVRR